MDYRQTITGGNKHGRRIVVDTNVILKFLLECNADKTICSFEKMRALDYAYSRNENGGYEEIISLLNV